MSDAILTINAGSSSVKAGFFDVGSATTAKILARETHSLEKGATHEDALAELLHHFDRAFPQVRIVAAGHRVVHGGESFISPVLVTPDIRAALGCLTPLAPLHQPHNLAAIDALARLHPHLPQIACFDTAFHAGQAWEATAFALPRELSAQGIRRYGFHGLSYEYIASVLRDHLGACADGRVIIAHLGSGASMCAMLQRRSVATTMGFTALDGLPMGTRSGTLDAGILPYLWRQGWSEERLSDMLWHRSGLLGISGLSADIRTLLASSDPRAAQAVTFFCYRAARELGSLIVALGGIDALVFTGGIGEHQPAIRARICELASCLGIRIDANVNERNQTRITGAKSQVEVYVIPTDEETMVARHTEETLRAQTMGAPP